MILALVVVGRNIKSAVEGIKSRKVVAMEDINIKIDKLTEIKEMVKELGVSL